MAAAKSTLGEVILQADGVAIHAVKAEADDTCHCIVDQRHRVVIQASQTVFAFRHIGAVVEARLGDTLVGKVKKGKK